MAPLDPISDSGISSQDPHEKNTATDANNGGDGNGAHGTGNGTLTTIESRLPSVPTLNWSYGPPPRPEILSAKPNPVELLHAIRRRWALALGLGLTVSILATGLLWFLLPVKYEAYALMKVSGKPPTVLDKVNAATEEFAVFKRTQVQLILSNVVLNGTLRNPIVNRLAIVRENSDDPVSWLKGQLLIDYPDDAEIMRIALKAKRSDEAVKLVDEVVNVYMKEIVQHDKQLRLDNEEKLRRAYEKQSADYEKELDALRLLESIHKTSGSEAAQLKKKMAIAELNAAMANRDRTRQLLSDIGTEMSLVRARKEKPTDISPAAALIDAEVSNDPLIIQMTQQTVALNDHLEQVRGVATNPASMGIVQNLQRRILGLEESIDERKAQLRPKLMEQMAAKITTKQKDAYPYTEEHLEYQQKYQLEELAKIEEAVKKLTDDVAGLEFYSAQVAAKQEDLNQLRLIKNRLRAELDEIQVERLAPDRITKVDQAIIANGSGDAMRKHVSVAFTGILSFSLIVLAVAFVEFQSRKVNSVKEVNDGLGIRVVGELPSISGRAFRRVRGGKGQSVLKALMAERIDGTRTALIHTTAIDPP
ncbi:MAG: hypothetical protein WDZ48_05750, partial [Pirellulales bacterium]